MTVSTRTSLLLWVMLPAFTMSADVPSCQTRSKSQEDHEMTNYTGPLINTESCAQKPVVLYPNGIWKLTSTYKNPLHFVFTPHRDFEYFEVLFSRGHRSRVYNTMRVNKSLVDAGPYSVNITFRSEPVTSNTPRIVGGIFINPRDDPFETNRESGGNPRYPPDRDDSFVDSIKEITCSTKLAPESHSLSSIVILVVGGSEWLFLPHPDWSNCPSTPPTRDFNIHENSRRNPDNESNNRGPPRNPVVSTTTAFPNHRPRTTKPPVETRFISTTYAWDHKIQPRLPEYDHYGRNRSSSPPPDVDGYLDDRVNGDDQKQPTSYATEGRDNQKHPTSNATEGRVGQKHLTSNATEGRVLKESGIVDDAIIAASIVGVLAIILLAIGCCFLFRHLNLQGSYGIHDNTYEPQSSLHLRDSQYDNDNHAGTSNPGHTATEATTSHTTQSAASQQKTPSDATTAAGSQQQHGGGGASNQTIDVSEGTPC